MKMRWIILILFTWSSLALSQTLMQLGQFSFTEAAAPSFRQPVDFSPRFFRRTGGVAFSAIAQGQDGQKIHSIKYSANKPDGKRILAKIELKNGDLAEVSLDLHDWEFKPIFEFAASKYGSAVTLFGELENKEDENALREEGAQFLNYHKSLEDTLVGLRLMQADLLLLDKDLAVDLPKIGDEIVLGQGETASKLEDNESRYDKVDAAFSNAIYTTILTEGFPKSYVIGDLNTEITYKVVGDEVRFSGQPRWTFWSNAESEENSDIDDSTPVKILTGMSDEVSRVIASQEGINPTVYSLLQKVMHYRAFFVSYKREKPDEFSNLLKQVALISIEPSVVTPTVMHRPGYLH